MLNPFKQDETDGHWHKMIWEQILSIHYGLKDLDDVVEPYRRRYALSKMSVTSPEIMKRFKELNKGKAPRGRMKPFNFVIIGTSIEPRKHTLEAIKPTIPFTKDYHMAPYRDFIDYHSGKTYNGIQYWKPMDDVFRDYFGHQESKFEGQYGTLDRKVIEVPKIVHIGKESQKLEVTNILGVDHNGYEVYNRGDTDEETRFKEMISTIHPNAFRRYGIGRSQFYKLKGRMEEGVPLHLSTKTKVRLRTMSEALGCAS